MNPDPLPARAWLGFELAGKRYAVPLADVREVIRPGSPTPVPGAPEDVLGIISLRGNILTVLDGRRRLGVADAASGNGAEQRVVVFHDGDEHVGMRIDAIGDVIDLDSRGLAPPTGHAGACDDPVLGLLRHGDDFITLLDAGKLCRPREAAMEATT